MGFLLNGKSYELTKDEVVQKLGGVSPNPVHRYWIAVGDRRFPPKQVLSVALGLQLSTFTTMDANRVLRAMGFEIAGNGGGPVKTESERLFEQYLRESGLTEFSFEPELQGTSKRPDYLLPFHDSELLFEIKELHSALQELQDSGLMAIDPYRAIRQKIDDAREKFRDLDSYCCSLVLYNCGKPVSLLPYSIYGAMLGNFGIRMPWDATTESFSYEKSTPHFGAKGKMIRYGGGHRLGPQNQTLSAIVVFEEFAPGQRRFQAVLDMRKLDLGRELTFPECWRAMEDARGTDRDCSLVELRVAVYENPFARMPLPRELFRGPYDEHYGCTEEGIIKRLYIGPELKRIEQAEEAVEQRRSAARPRDPLDCAHEQQWLAQHGKEYAGKWVALDGYRLIAHGDQAQQVYDAAHKAGVALPLVVQVESPDELPFGGW